MKEGLGVFCWPEGRRYEGNFSQDRRNGFGIMMWPNGRWYAGFWREGAKDGEGIECEDEVRAFFPLLRCNCQTQDRRSATNAMHCVSETSGHKIYAALSCFFSCAQMFDTPIMQIIKN
jgi:hypothetical protein